MRPRRMPRLFVGVVLGLMTVGLGGQLIPTGEGGSGKLPEIRLCVTKDVCLTVEVAATDEARQRGLMFRTHLPADRGMLFVFDTEDFWPFWMKNTRIPLDMIWIGSDKTVAFILEDVPPCPGDPCPTYRPLRKARYVLEVPAGSVRKWKLSVGQPLTFQWPPKNRSTQGYGPVPGFHTRYSVPGVRRGAAEGRERKRQLLAGDFRENVPIGFTSCIPKCQASPSGR
jgi:uncharacterized membrane protein (UPF0127 family)